MYWVTGIVGFVLTLAPFMFGYRDNTPALVTSLLLGGSLIAVSYIESTSQEESQWEYVVTMLAGITAVAAPFLLDFGNNMTATWITVTLGIAVAILAVSKLNSGGSDLTDIP